MASIAAAAAAVVETSASARQNPLSNHLPTIQRCLRYLDTRGAARLCEYASVCAAWHELLTEHSYPLLRDMKARFPAGPSRWLTSAAGAGIPWLVAPLMHLNAHSGKALLVACEAGQATVVELMLAATVVVVADDTERDEQDEIDQMWEESFRKLHQKNEQQQQQRNDADEPDDNSGDEKSSTNNCEEASEHEQLDLVFSRHNLLRLCDEQGRTALHLSNSLALVKMIYARCPGLLLARSYTSETPLHTIQSTEALRWLLTESGATRAELRKCTNVAADRLTKGGAIPLHVHARRHDFDVCKLLLACDPITVGRPDAQLRVILHIAAQEKMSDLVHLLLTEYKADPVAGETHNCSPIYIAASRGDAVSFDHLLAAGAKMTRLLLIAVLQQNTAMMELLLSRGAAIDGGPLHEAARRQSAEMISLLLTEAAARCNRRGDVRAPAPAAASTGDAGTTNQPAASPASSPPSVAALVNELSNITGMAPLHELVTTPWNGSCATAPISALRTLLSAPGIDVNIQTSRTKETVLHLLAKVPPGGSIIGFVNVLLEFDGATAAATSEEVAGNSKTATRKPMVDLTICDSEGRTPIDLAQKLNPLNAPAFLSAVKAWQLQRSVAAMQ